MWKEHVVEIVERPSKVKQKALTSTCLLIYRLLRERWSQIALTAQLGYTGIGK